MRSRACRSAILVREGTPRNAECRDDSAGPWTASFCKTRAEVRRNSREVTHMESRSHCHQVPSRCNVRFVCFVVLVGAFFCTPANAQKAFDPGTGIVLRGTIVTMDSIGTILQNGSILVRNGAIVAIWQGQQAPQGVPLGNAIEVDLGPEALIF